MERKLSSSSLSRGSGKRGDLALQACGHSVRRMQEDINLLIKENFKLKLRNYHYSVEEAQRRSNRKNSCHSAAKIKLEEELRDTRRELDIYRHENDNLKRKLSKIYDMEKENKMLAKALKEKDMLFKEATVIISEHQEQKYKADKFVDEVQQALKAYDQSQ
ncbi:hypothetical protein KR054_000746 [Drosophila jambulina]|nr:hypothetical protein KR054_000746 [Drosophila jambulina]